MAGSITELQVKRIFDSLKGTPAGAMPAATTLSSELQKEVDKHSGVPSFNVPQEIVKLFATASIEMWHRSLHSYLISLSLTSSSHIWCSVAGYYSSHYSVRSLAHALGVFQLFDAGKIIELDLTGANNTCNVRKKTTIEGREHNMYWKFVKSKPPFDSDPLFTINRPNNGQLSDAKHRERANYADHIDQVPNFTPLDLLYLKERANHIAKIPLDDPPIPDSLNYAELENVQIVAYHRMVTVRNYLDDILGTSINYWKVNRDPAWARTIVNYEIVESDIGNYINI